jgi:hypothetical protein
VQATALTGFDAVLGTRRGSAVAQKQRDVAEQSFRERELAAFSEFIEINNDGRELVSVLVRAYDHSKFTSAAGYNYGIRALEHIASEDGVRAFIAVVRCGDPGGWPGLTAPALQVLAHYFLSPSLSGADMPTPASLRAGATHAIEHCFMLQPAAVKADPELYRRLAPLCEGLGAFFLWLPHLDHNQTSITRYAINVLSEAPAEAVRGPLRSWVRAFTERANAGKLGVTECALLEALIESRAAEAGLEGVFEELARRLLIELA